MDREYCIECDEETGRAGKGEDSLYTEEDEGPFCETCWFELLTLKEDNYGCTSK